MLKLTVESTGTGSVTISDEELEMLVRVILRKGNLDPTAFEERVRAVVKDMGHRPSPTDGGSR